MKTSRIDQRIGHEPAGPARRRQRGNMMIGTMLAMVIGSIMALVVYDQYTDSQRKTRLEAATSEISTMIAEAQKVYGAANQYGSVTTAIAVQGGVVPTRLRIAGTNTAQNKYNGAVTMTPATITSANDSLTLGYANVRREDCQDVVMSVEKLNRGVSVAGTAVKPNDGTLNLASLATACDTTANVAVNFTFGRQ